MGQRGRDAGARANRRRRYASSKPRREQQSGGLVILLNKPYDVLCKFSDSQDRATLADYVAVPGVYPAGRLDKDSEGLVLLTDDGQLAHRVTHPRHKLPKAYLVQVEGRPAAGALAALRRGVEIPDQREAGGNRLRTAPAQVELLVDEPDLWPRAKPVRPYGEKCWLRMVIQEGKKRQVRHMTAAAGHPTLRLIRVAIGPLSLAGLQPGQWRNATPEELAALRQALRTSHR